MHKVVYNILYICFTLYTIIGLICFTFNFYHIIHSVHGTCMGFLWCSLWITIYFWSFLQSTKKNKQVTRGLVKDLLVYWIPKEAEPLGLTTHPYCTSQKQRLHFRKWLNFQCLMIASKRCWSFAKCQSFSQNGNSKVWCVFPPAVFPP